MLLNNSDNRKLTCQLLLFNIYLKVTYLYCLFVVKVFYQYKQVNYFLGNLVADVLTYAIAKFLIRTLFDELTLWYFNIFGVLMKFEKLAYFIVIYLLDWEWKFHLNQVYLIFFGTFVLLTIKDVDEIRVREFVAIRFSFNLVDDVIESINLN